MRLYVVLSKIIILLFTVFLAHPSNAGECLLSEALKNPQISGQSLVDSVKKANPAISKSKLW